MNSSLKIFVSLDTNIPCIYDPLVIIKKYTRGALPLALEIFIFDK